MGLFRRLSKLGDGSSLLDRSSSQSSGAGPSISNNMNVGRSISVRTTPNEKQTYQPPSSAPPGYLEMHKQGEEDPLDFLRDFDTAFLIDDSGSMAGSRWREARDALASVAETAARYDDDGIDIEFLNDKHQAKGIKTASQVIQLFDRVKPSNGTPTGRRLDTILNRYVTTLENSNAESVKPLNLLVLTDGEPSDDPASVLVAVARRLDRGNFPLSALGVQFVQIGNDKEAKKALQELDDEISAEGNCRDIVDTLAWSDGGKMDGAWIIKALLGGINRKLDKRALNT